MILSSSNLLVAPYKSHFHSDAPLQAGDFHINAGNILASDLQVEPEIDSLLYDPRIE